jgi:hypothetical protein
MFPWKKQMKLTINVPVTFTIDAVRGTGTRTALAFVPTELEIREASEDDAPLVARQFHTPRTLSSDYRVHGDKHYATLQRTDGRRFPHDIERELFRLIAADVKAEIEDIRVDDLYPRDARDVMAMVDRAEGYGEIDKISQSRLVEKMLVKANASPDFEDRRTKAVAVAAEAASRLLVVDGLRYKQTQGLAFKVDSSYNRTVRVSQLELWDGSKWAQKPGGIVLATDDMRSHYFAFAEREEALAFANETATALGQPLIVEDDEVGVFVEPGRLPKQDFRWAELVRSASTVAQVTGLELARRFKNQERSIFTDDRSLRYAFDGLMEALDDVDPFGEHDERLEVAARSLLDIALRNSRAIDARYRNLTTRWSDAFSHLDVALARWYERPLDINFGYRNGAGGFNL